jgi:hypothetical protein
MSGVPNFFHVSAEVLTLGQVIPTGHFGETHRRKSIPGYAMNQTEVRELFWELILETARLAATPNGPSRLNCMFGTRAIESTRPYPWLSETERRVRYRIVDSAPITNLI